MLLNDIGLFEPGSSVQREWPASANTTSDGRATTQTGVSGKVKSGVGTSRRTTLEQQWTVASQNAVKMIVNKDGWMRVTRDELVAAGLDANADPRRLQLFADGIEQAMSVTSDGSIEFYGRALNTPMTDGHVYWLVTGATSGIRIPGIWRGRP